MDLTFIDRALGSDIPYITYAVPVFFLLIGAELAVSLWQHKHSYRLHDSINDLSCGITEQIKNRPVRKDLAGCRNRGAVFMLARPSHFSPSRSFKARFCDRKLSKTHS